MVSSCRALAAKKEIQSAFDGRKYEIEYFLLEKEAQNEKTTEYEQEEKGKIYGVGLKKTPQDGAEQNEIFEAFITRDKRQASKIIEGLAQGLVTPLCAPEAIDYLFDKTL